MRSELRRFPRCSGLTAALALAVLAEPARAHDGFGSGGFLSGLAHPVSGADHIAAMVAVGIWGAQLGKPAIWLLPVLFPVVMAVGGFLGLVGVQLPGVEVGIALSAIVLGAMVALDAKPPLWMSIAVVSVFAVFHGHAHGTELPEDQDGLVYSAGFVISTGLLHLAGIALGMLDHLERGARILRAAGCLICSAGAYFLWLATS